LTIICAIGNNLELRFTSSNQEAYNVKETTEQFIMHWEGLHSLLNKGQALGKLTSCEDDFVCLAWFDHLKTFCSLVKTTTTNETTEFAE